MRDLLDHLLVINHPEGMSESFRRSHKVVLRLAGAHARNNSIQVLAVRVRKENRLHVGIQHAHMFHTVFLFIATRQLVLLDTSLQVVIYPRANHQTVLGLFFPAGQRVICQDGLGIDIVPLLRILHQPSFRLKSQELLYSGFIHPRIMFIRTRRKIDLRLDDVVQTLRIAGCLFARLFRIQHIVGTAADLFHQVFWRPYTLKWLDLHSTQIMLIVGLL